MQDLCLGVFRCAPLPLGGRGRGRVFRRDGSVPGFARRRVNAANVTYGGVGAAASAGAQAAPQPVLPRKRGRSSLAVIGTGIS